MKPKAGEGLRFPVDATSGSEDTRIKRWVQVLISPGKETYLFAVRPDLRIPGATPMTYVGDSTAVTTFCWVEDGDSDSARYTEVYSPHVLVRDAWGRDPAAEKAEADFDAKHGPPSFFSQAARADWYEMFSTLYGVAA